MLSVLFVWMGVGGVSVWVHAFADVVGCVHMALTSAGRIALCPN